MSRNNSAWIVFIALTAALTTALTAGGAAAQHAGDILLEVDSDSRIVTGLIDEDNGEITHDVRVFGSEFGESGIFNFTDEPGFCGEDGTFPPQSLVGFNVLDALGAWNGAGFDPAAETLTISFGNLQVTTGNGFVPGFGLNTDSGGGWHRHLGFTLNDVDESDSGVYLLELEIWHESEDILTSKPFFVVFNFNESEEVHDAALEWVEGQLGVEVLPESFERLRGLAVEGDLSDLLESDDARLVTRPDVFAPAPLDNPAVQVEVSATSPVTTPSEIRFTVESRASVADAIRQNVLLYDYVAEQYVRVDQRIIGIEDATIEVVVDVDAPNFIDDSTGEMRGLVQHVGVLFSLPPTWSAGLDRTIWSIIE